MSFFEHYNAFGERVIAALKEVLESDAAEVVKDVMGQKLDEKVYSYEASDEAMESRRYDQGGLADRDNMVAHVEYDDGYVLVVENVAPFQEPSEAKGRSLSDVVQEGLPAYRQPGPRTFTSDTESECVSSGSVLNAINDGLRRKCSTFRYTHWENGMGQWRKTYWDFGARRVY